MTTGVGGGGGGGGGVGGAGAGRSSAPQRIQIEEVTEFGSLHSGQAIVASAIRPAVPGNLFKPAWLSLPLVDASCAERTQNSG